MVNIYDYRYNGKEQLGTCTEELRINHQLLTANYQLLTVNYQLSTINC